MTKEAAEILQWYDRHARDLPWRVPPNVSRAPDPYHVWLSEIMLQQTTVAAVKAYFNRFTTTWPRVEDLAAAKDQDVMAAWAGLGYYARARNLLKTARIVAGTRQFPKTETDLLTLPGIGPYTAAAIAAIAYDHRSVVVDGNVERVMARYFDLQTPLPAVKPDIRAKAEHLTPNERPGDYAQAVMDLGATICTPKIPACGICPWMKGCKGRASGSPESLPMRTPKPVKPTRFGHAYYCVGPDGAILLEQRPPSGLLGGMMGFPGSDWTASRPDPAPPISARWQTASRDVSHVFTHFRLELTVHVAKLDKSVDPQTGQFVAAHQFTDTSLPTVFRKVYRIGTDTLSKRPT